MHLLETESLAVVVIPTYDEAGSIRSTIHEVLSTMPAATQVLVVDDASPDGTADLVRQHPQHGGRVHLVTPVRRDGLGAAYRVGFAWALARGADVVVQMDADGSHPASRLPAMIAALEGADLVIGSRYVAGGGVRGWPRTRLTISRAANAYARSMLGLAPRDCTAGYRAWRADVVRDLGLVHTTADGYGFQVETTLAAQRAGCRVVEVPITFRDRTAGRSKMSARVALEAAALVLRWRVAAPTRGRELGCSRERVG